MKQVPLTPEEFMKDFTYWYLQQMKKNNKPYEICKYGNAYYLSKEKGRGGALKSTATPER